MLPSARFGLRIRALPPPDLTEAVKDQVEPELELELAAAEVIEDGKVTPVIDREYPFGELPSAVRYQEEGHASGKVVVTF